MTIAKKVKTLIKKGRFVPYKNRVVMTPGQSLRVLRELQELTQNELAQKSGLPQPTISGMESGRINIGVERAKTLAIALKVHPALIVFPGWDTEHAS